MGHGKGLGKGREETNLRDGTRELTDTAMVFLPSLSATAPATATADTHKGYLYIYVYIYGNSI